MTSRLQMVAAGRCSILRQFQGCNVIILTEAANENSENKRAEALIQDCPTHQQAEWYDTPCNIESYDKQVYIVSGNVTMSP